MIDLRQKGLPFTIMVGGEPFLIKTDFRDWLQFGELIKEDATLDKFLYLFEGKHPTDGTAMIEALLEFYENPNATPHDTGEAGNAKAVDYILDGEYIFGASMQTYGIDLIECGYMHWWKFKALFISLPSTCKISEIMGLRTWRKDSRDYEAQCRHNKEVWRLPSDSMTAEEQAEIIADINDEFYNC